LLLPGCSGGAATRGLVDPEPVAPSLPTPEADAPPREVDTRPPPMARPVPLWEGGRIVRDVDAAHAREHGLIVLDLGDGWAPYLFGERGNESEPIVPNGYRQTYLALARGEFPDDIHGDRARDDEYLELFGIAPSLSLLRTRMKATNELTCAPGLDLSALQSFEGTIAFTGNDEGRRAATRFEALDREVQRMLAREHVETVAQLDRARLSEREEGALEQYEQRAPRARALLALQARLECEGFYRGLGRYAPGALDRVTHEALARLEKRHRVYGWGFVGAQTLAVIRRTPMETERDDLVRVLTERAIHAAGVIEDGSTSTKPDGTPRTFRGRDGAEHPIPNLEADLRDALVSAFGLETPEKALAFLDGLGELPANGEKLVAFAGPPLPEYYDGDMELSVEVDRGDVWYEFPYDDLGQERSQPIERRPHETIFVTYGEQRIPLARFGTTIGGWRSDFIDGVEWWKYKGSPFGPVVWTEIVAAPVWLPPESTPPRALLDPNPRRRHAGEKPYVVNLHETGPSYASAYGLVAAYHHTFRETGDGALRIYGDEGIRTHGSVDYMSIMRRYSHGCHRLHNHIAVRLMSFVLAHRPHRRVGMQNVNFERELEYEGETYDLKIDQGGYVFELERPLRVEVLEGRIRGSVAAPITFPIPKFDTVRGGYVLPDGGAVLVRGNQLVPTTLAPVDGSVPSMDGGVPMARVDGGWGTTR
jgi:hypothetical protein